MSANPLSAAMQAWGATFTPAVVQPGQSYWQLISADGPVEWGGRISVYVDVIDEAGRRAIGVPVAFYWHGGGNDTQNVKLTESKNGEPFSVDWPMNAGGHAYGVHVADGLPSDDVFGMGLGSFVPHHTFKLIFRRTIAAGAPPVPEPLPIPPVTEPPATARDFIEQAMAQLAAALDLLP